MSIPTEDVEAGRVDLSDIVTGERLPEVTPGEVLLEEFMRPLGLSARMLGRQLGVPSNRVTAILNGSRAITADTALRLAERFGTSAELWMNLQTGYDLRMARAQRRAA